MSNLSFCHNGFYLILHCCILLLLLLSSADAFDLVHSQSYLWWNVLISSSRNARFFTRVPLTVIIVLPEQTLLGLGGSLAPENIFFFYPERQKISAGARVQQRYRDVNLGGMPKMKVVQIFSTAHFVTPPTLKQ